MELEDEEAASRKSRKFAADVILEICGTSDLQVVSGRGSVPVASMTTSRTFMENLMKIAMFSGNMRSFSDFKTGAKPWKGVPVSLIATFFMYSLKVCPVNDDGHADQKRLAESVFDLEVVFGPIPTDPIIMAEICNPAASPVKSRSADPQGMEDFYG